MFSLCVFRSLKVLLFVVVVVVFVLRSCIKLEIQKVFINQSASKLYHLNLDHFQ